MKDEQERLWGENNSQFVKEARVCWGIVFVDLSDQVVLSRAEKH